MPVPKKPTKKKKGKVADARMGGGAAGVAPTGRAVSFSDEQRVFINVLVETGNREEAAKAAGVDESKAKDRARDWLKNPLVKAEYSRRVQQQNSRADFKADELLRQLQIGAFLDYRGWFKPDVRNSGGWLISKEHYEEMPADVARIIESAELVYEYDAEGNPVETGMYRVFLIDRKTMISLCARAMLGDKMGSGDKNVTQINWHQLIMTNQQRPVEDVVEERIRGLKQLVNQSTSEQMPQMPVGNPAAKPIFIMPPNDPPGEDISERAVNEADRLFEQGQRVLSQTTDLPLGLRLVPDAAAQLATEVNEQLREEADRIAKGE
jgi:hypothetical protein